MSDLALLALGISAAAAGLFTGLMMTLVVLMEPTWNRHTPTDAIRTLQTFLEVAKGHPIIAGLTFVGLLLPIVALVLLWQVGNIAALILTGAGWLSFGIGVFVVTVWLNLPLYEVLMGLEPDSPSANWQTSRGRFYWLNRVRGIASGTALLLFLGAMAVL